MASEKVQAMANEFILRLILYDRCQMVILQRLMDMDKYLKVSTFFSFSLSFLFLMELLQYEFSLPVV